MRVLIIEDEKDLAKNIKRGLQEEGLAVDTALDGEEGKFMAETEPYDLVILDLMLPKLDGITLCGGLRKKGIKIPILMLTAKTELENKVEGLNLGADDYLTKPFAFSELKARIFALLRRGNATELPVLKVDNLRLDPQKHEAYRAGDTLKLTPKEFSILEFLLRNKDKVVTRTMITEHVWDYNFESLSNLVDVLIGTLRKKVDKKGQKKLIHTVYGIGFKISEDL
ncbi:DNA-binding response regulator [candidate division WWE3 bacterium RIFCSPHIGHO2_01_FULL_40_23]|uniref:DNA-binding response regulator n=1 Tax=candidate division WWE3 bacterium RIFCSPLOWO2_01_FULL_41_18 TaxID=1802625 RepID=A0A1F4VDV8_UNCKA|nr:MAG: DNA-binding response regulator [candidate division WWE3 bacterium RIFCSPHIGHO2_01_FULL_40_23]OGC55344.1 MAG: DNA-binding response regulator [candidate division WWE3 bacterium RIFCSPLOWO2_01_FULL_41_18]